ncbi:HAMP domain-containing sensor histidine kinase [Paenibacillus illinoisensis]|uniref:sensor histidine kinase n=1 Tax=Paenibacillus illinoisensis TaxID=59845 RepID=UPI001C8EF230|nr:HAMP domain-containing sensor histidine kinase [Paenibacillus illinoisensis]MBY0215755.1 HAMP domain-containing histidine kinase [Paenibacillus illinoisensis]
MKLKYWLMIAFLIVMLLPVAAGWALFSLYNYYNDQRSVAEYVELTGRLAPIEKRLSDPGLYRLQSSDAYASLSGLASDQVNVDLYLPSGIRVYTSGGDTWAAGAYTVRGSELYRDLYDMQIRHRTFTLKKPVWEKGEHIGIYEITMLRGEWLEGISVRTAWVIGFAGVFFILLYGTVLWLLSRKLFRPMRDLMGRMHAFARGEVPVDNVPARRDEMGMLLEQFDAMQEKVRQTSAEVEKEQKEKELMVASLSHDLKTPLMSISAYAEALSVDAPLEPSERRDYRDVLFGNVERMKHMIGELEMYTALGSSELEMAMVEVEGEEFFDMLLGSYGGLAERGQIEVRTGVRTDRLYRLHPEQLMRLTDNLINNALRHTSKNGLMGLGVIASDQLLPEWVIPTLAQELNEYRTGATLILVQNEGTAIPEEQLDRIFEPYVQHQNQEEKAYAGSSGLGLSIAKRIAIKHGGEMRMWSAEGYGTLAACRLPEL